MIMNEEDLGKEQRFTERINIDHFSQPYREFERPRPPLPYGLEEVLCGGRWWGDMLTLFYVCIGGWREFMHMHYRPLNLSIESSYRPLSSYRPWTHWTRWTRSVSLPTTPVEPYNPSCGPVARRDVGLKINMKETMKKISKMHKISPLTTSQKELIQRTRYAIQKTQNTKHKPLTSDAPVAEA